MHIALTNSWAAAKLAPIKKTCLKHSSVLFSEEELRVIINKSMSYTIRHLIPESILSYPNNYSESWQMADFNESSQEKPLQTLIIWGIR